MKILFLYNDEAHAEPLLRARAYSEHEFIFDEREGYDAILVHQEMMQERYLSKPVIILERIDGAQLGTSRRWLTKVNGVFKGYTFVDPTLHNKYRGRVFVEEMQRHLKNYSIPNPVQNLLPAIEFEEKDLAKIHSLYGFGAYSKIQSLRDISFDWSAKRRTSVQFAGTVEYRGTAIEIHRRLAAQAANMCRDGVGLCGRVLNGVDYYKSMINSKMVLCPYGWGEATHCDYEAMLLGCIVIRPNCVAVDTHPQIFVPGETFIPCRPDFLDVPPIVKHVCEHYDDYLDWRKRARQLALDSGDYEKIAERFDYLIGEVL